MNPDGLEATLRGVFSTGPPGIVAVCLFGSQARRTATPTSDVDIAVLYGEPPPRSLEGLPLDLEAELERSGAERVLRPPTGSRPLSSAADRGPVTDPDLIAEKLALSETCVRELRTLSRPAEIPTDKVQERFAEHTLQIAILLSFARVIRSRLA